jgi:hypothetical protein
MTSREALIKRYGVTMSIKDLSEVFQSKSPNAMRGRMLGKDNGANRLLLIRRRMGRKVYWLTLDVAEFIAAENA